MPRVLVTGASGFVGASATRAMRRLGWPVAVVLRRQAGAVRIGDLIPTLTVIEGNLDTLHASEHAFRAFAPDVVVHCAWAGVQGADRNDRKQIANIGWTMQLLEMTARAGAKHFVGLGSQAEYGPCPARIDETTPTRPTTLYGATKLATSIVSARLAPLEGMDLTWLRLFSPYGPCAHDSWLIPNLVRRLLSGECPDLTAGDQAWDFVHVDDVAEAIVCAISAQAVGIFNIGSGQACPLKDVIVMIRDMIDPSLPLGFGRLPYRPDQVMHLEADISAFTRATSWQPRVSLEAGLAETVAWYRRKSAVHSR